MGGSSLCLVGSKRIKHWLVLGLDLSVYTWTIYDINMCVDEALVSLVKTTMNRTSSKKKSDRYHYEYQKEWFHRINSEKDLSYYI